MASSLVNSRRVRLIRMLALHCTIFFPASECLDVFRIQIEPLAFPTLLGKTSVTIGFSPNRVTGAEALYVDLGNFGRRPVALAWYGVVFSWVMSALRSCFQGLPPPLMR
jgi:hypothetical protein